MWRRYIPSMSHEERSGISDLPGSIPGDSAEGISQGAPAASRASRRRGVVIAASVVVGVLVVVGGGLAAAAVMTQSDDDKPNAVETPGSTPRPTESAPAEGPILVTAPAPRITCAQLTPATPITVSVHDLGTLSLAATDHSEVDSVLGVAGRQAGVAECSWSGWDGRFAASITALPDAAAAYAAQPVDAGAVVGTVTPDSRIACQASSCQVDLLVNDTWVQLWITPGPIAFTTPVQSAEQELVKVVEPIAIAVRDHLATQTIGAAWSYDERVLDAADACDPQVATDVWGAASTPKPRQGGGGAAGAVPGLALCAVGESVAISAVTAGGWSWDSPTNTGDDVEVEGATQARVACSVACAGRLVVEGTRIDLWTSDTTAAAWTEQAAAFVAALLD